ncbi:unnamed protein product, partial [Oppiella nova]
MRDKTQSDTSLKTSKRDRSEDRDRGDIKRAVHFNSQTRFPDEELTDLETSCRVEDIPQSVSSSRDPLLVEGMIGGPTLQSDDTLNEQTNGRYPQEYSQSHQRFIRDGKGPGVNLQSQESSLDCWPGSQEWDDTASQESYDCNNSMADNSSSSYDSVRDIEESDTESMAEWSPSVMTSTPNVYSDAIQSRQSIPKRSHTLYGQPLPSRQLMQRIEVEPPILPDGTHNNQESNTGDRQENTDSEDTREVEEPTKGEAFVFIRHDILRLKAHTVGLTDGLIVWFLFSKVWPLIAPTVQRQWTAIRKKTTKLLSSDIDSESQSNDRKDTKTGDRIQTETDITTATDPVDSNEETNSFTPTREDIDRLISPKGKGWRRTSSDYLYKRVLRRTAQLGCLSTDYNSQRLLFELLKRRTGMAANSDELCLQIAARLEIFIQTMYGWELCVKPQHLHLAHLVREYKRRMNELNANWFGRTIAHRLWDTVLLGLTRMRWALGRLVASEAAVGAHRSLLTRNLSNENPVLPQLMELLNDMEMDPKLTVLKANLHPDDTPYTTSHESESSGASGRVVPHDHKPLNESGIDDLTITSRDQFAP